MPNKTLELIEIVPDTHFVVTKLGIKKSYMIDDILAEHIQTINN